MYRKHLYFISKYRDRYKITYVSSPFTKKMLIFIPSPAYEINFSSSKNSASRNPKEEKKTISVFYYLEL